jgi:hypothetical protein
MRGVVYLKPVQIKPAYFQQYKVAHLWSARDSSPLFIPDRNLAAPVNFNFSRQSCDSSQHSKPPV